MQRGRIERRGNTWLLRYRETVIENGKQVTRQTSKKIATYSRSEYPSAASVQHLAEELLAPINAKKARPASTDTVVNFMETYLLYCAGKLRPSTVKGYRDLFRLAKEHLDGIRLRDFRTSDADRLLESVAKSKPRARTSLRNLKTFMSGCFRYAKRTDAISGENPVRDAEVPTQLGLARGKTHAYSLEEIQLMLAVLPEPARTAVLMLALTGLRLSEIKGLKWEDFCGNELRVSRSVWSGKVAETKTEASAASVPVLPIISEALVEHRKRTTGEEWIFPGATGKPLRLENTLRRTIRPALKKAKLQWHGFHAFRRGLATNLYSLGAADKVIQDILRHANVSTTLNYYIRPVPAESQAAMKKLSEAFQAARKIA